MSALNEFSSDTLIKGVYYPESEPILRKWAGAKHVVMFDHATHDGAQSPAPGASEPLRYVHNDQTFVTGPRRVRDLLPVHEAAELLKRRYAIVNLRRPIRHEVDLSPLALCDSRSIDLHDLVYTNEVA